MRNESTQSPEHEKFVRCRLPQHMTSFSKIETGAPSFLSFPRRKASSSDRLQKSLYYLKCGITASSSDKLSLGNGLRASLPFFSCSLQNNRAQCSLDRFSTGSWNKRQTSATAEWKESIDRGRRVEGNSRNDDCKEKENFS